MGDNQQESAENIRTEIYRRMSPVQKWEQVMRLREVAWLVKSASIRASHPDWSEEAIESEVKKIFLYATT